MTNDRRLDNSSGNSSSNILTAFISRLGDLWVLLCVKFLIYVLKDLIMLKQIFEQEDLLNKKTI